MSPNPPAKVNHGAHRRGLTELKGKIFGDLTVLGKVPTPNGQGIKQRWKCRCVCGNEVVVRHDYLLHTNCPKTHCGCRRKGLPTLHKSTYSVWQGMMLRCHTPTHMSYAKYGGAGIHVCPEWQTFEGFLKGMGDRPSKGHSLDRIDPYKGYEPGNVRWATQKVQARNKRNTIYVIHPDTKERVPAAQVADDWGVSYQVMRERLIKAGIWPTQPQPQQKTSEPSDK